MLPGNADPRRPEKVQRYKPPPTNNNAAPGDDLTPDYMNILDSQKKAMHATESRSDRFKIVKVESLKPFQRGRWKCMDFLDRSTYNSSKPNDFETSASSIDDTNAINWKYDSEAQNAVIHIFHKQNNKINEKEIMTVPSVVDVCQKSEKNHIFMTETSSLSNIKYLPELNLLLNKSTFESNNISKENCEINFQNATSLLENTTNTTSSTPTIEFNHSLNCNICVGQECYCDHEKLIFKQNLSTQSQNFEDMSTEPQNHFTQNSDISNQINNHDSNYQLRTDVYNTSSSNLNITQNLVSNNGSQLISSQEPTCVQTKQEQSIFNNSDKKENVAEPFQNNMINQNIVNQQQSFKEICPENITYQAYKENSVENQNYIYVQNCQPENNINYKYQNRDTRNMNQNVSSQQMVYHEQNVINKNQNHLYVEQKQEINSNNCNVNIPSQKIVNSMANQGLYPQQMQATYKSGPSQNFTYNSHQYYNEENQNTIHHTQSLIKCNEIQNSNKQLNSNVPYENFEKKYQENHHMQSLESQTCSYKPKTDEMPNNNANTQSSIGIYPQGNTNCSLNPNTFQPNLQNCNAHNKNVTITSESYHQTQNIYKNISNEPKQVELPLQQPDITDNQEKSQQKVNQPQNTCQQYLMPCQEANSNKLMYVPVLSQSFVLVNANLAMPFANQENNQESQNLLTNSSSGNLLLPLISNGAPIYLQSNQSSTLISNTISNEQIIESPSSTPLNSQNIQKNKLTPNDSGKSLNPAPNVPTDIQLLSSQKYLFDKQNTYTIDDKIEAIMDLVKKHLKFAVMEEVQVLKQNLLEMKERIAQLEHENGILKRRNEELSNS